ncbi:Ig-like domain-containing protein [Clostridium tetani]|uniref:Ig-like domain-containing protein n=1 Tax=Clostridium tetani TaxID=1513 RepID=UPI000513A4F3|nr:Ig-like domain-containing protein [Clostridium tetani]KGI37498.1 hypothetical protein LA33_11635 [Clostridium tetani ATCC 9441]RXI52803.1 hypothetical protein DP124_07915 [Clostridium tetani]RXI55766.1 hypothetical protein DP122_03810 [Clostridium tetani]RXI62640.1 hypothetical protein DP123_11055 [Clostridium tetani]RXM54761.1 hypothetical protein DP134_09640 [Clostridium tetani]
MKNKILSFFLTFCLLVINMPMTAKAFQIKDDDKTKIEETLNKLREYYSNSPKGMEYLEGMAYLHSSSEFEKSRKFLETKVNNTINNKNAMNCFKGIFIANTLGKDPYNFQLNETETLNYVEGMLNKYNKVKHIFYSQDNTNAKCILALDMAGADYDKEEVIKALIDNFNRNKSINKVAIVLTALSKHRDLPGVNEGIQKYKDHLKSLQKDDGGFDGAFGSYSPAVAISEVIQALIAIGEDPLSKEWIKNGKTMLDALMEYQTMEDGSFSKDKVIGSGSWAPKPVIDEEATRASFAALADLYKGKSMYEGFKNGEDSSQEPEPGTKPDIEEPEQKAKAVSIEVLIDGNKVEDALEMKVGESKSLTLEVKDEKGNKIEEAKTEVEIEGQLINLQNEKITAIKGGIEKITIKCDDVKKIININIKKEQTKPEAKPDVDLKPEPSGKEEILDKKELVAKTIKEIKEHYKQKEEKYTYLETLGLIFSGTDKEEIKDKVKIFEYDSIKCLEENIMAIKAIGEDPTNYNNKNYIELLLNPKETSFNDNYINVRARRILALDMANVEYDKEKDIKDLMAMAKSYNTSDFSLIVTAIANHQDIEGVKDFIERYKTYVKKVQLDNKNCIDLCDVIQALIAIGENPTSTKWAKTDKEGNTITLIDALLKYKEGNQFKPSNSKYSQTSDIYTAHALAALADTLNGKSMYTNIGKQKINIKNIIITSEEGLKEVDLNKTLQLSAKVFDYLDNEVLAKEIIWESSDKDVACVDEKGLINTKSEGNVRITAKLKEDESIKASFNVKVVDNKKAFSIEMLNNESLKNGEDARISVKTKSNAESEKEVNIIVALYNKSNEKMISYSCSEKSIKVEKDEIINTGFSIPKEGEFIAKILVWDDLKKGNSYCKPIILDISK